MMHLIVVRSWAMDGKEAANIWERMVLCVAKESSNVSKFTSMERYAFSSDASWSASDVRLHFSCKACSSI